MSETTVISTTSSKSCVTGAITFKTFVISKLKEHVEIPAENAKSQI